MLKRLSFALPVLILVGCAATLPSQGTKISAVRAAPPVLQEVHISIKRTDYVRALEGSRGSKNLRIVPMVVSAVQAPTTPEYRIFNVRKGNIGDVLGLENSDVLVAAHDYVIQSPSQFYNYLIAVQQEKQSQIEIRRGELPILIKFDLIE